MSGTGVLQNPAQVLTAAARERLAKVTQSDEVTTIVGASEVGPGNATATGTAHPISRVSFTHAGPAAG